MRPAHYNLKTGFAQTVSDEIGPRDHPGHRTDPDKTDILVFAKLHQLGPRHRLSVSVDQDYFVFGRRQRLEEKHPQMRHEIPRDTVIRIIK